jgi:hypothetical protein
MQDLCVDAMVQCYSDSCTKYERFAEQARWLFVDGDDDRSNNEGSES